MSRPTIRNPDGTFSELTEHQMEQINNYLRGTTPAELRADPERFAHFVNQVRLCPAPPRKLRLRDRLARMALRWLGRQLGFDRGVWPGPR